MSTPKSLCIFLTSQRFSNPHRLRRFDFVGAQHRHAQAQHAVQLPAQAVDAKHHRKHHEQEPWGKSLATVGLLSGSNIQVTRSNTCAQDPSHNIICITARPETVHTLRCQPWNFAAYKFALGEGGKDAHGMASSTFMSSCWQFLRGCIRPLKCFPKNRIPSNGVQDDFNTTLCHAHTCPEPPQVACQPKRRINHQVSMPCRLFGFTNGSHSLGMHLGAG